MLGEGGSCRGGLCGWLAWWRGSRVAVFSWVCEARRVVLFVPVSCDTHVCALAEHLRLESLDYI